MFYVYMLASKPYGNLYTGMTSDIARRVWEHKNNVVPDFTKKYGVHQLVWFEAHESRTRHRSVRRRSRNGSGTGRLI
jgi:putative endonuclease